MPSMTATYKGVFVDPCISVAVSSAPHCRNEANGKKVIDIALDGDEASDYINFVLKDNATGTWYDSNGSNFQMALVTTLRSFTSIDDAEMVRPQLLFRTVLPLILANVLGL
jgi:hypothetical protein